MSDLGNALTALIARLEQWSPTRDPQIRFNHATTPDEDSYRNFKIPADINVDLLKTTGHDQWEADLYLEVYYPGETEDYDLLASVVSDLEEIHERIAYFPGSEWDQANNRAWQVLSNEISEDKIGRVVLSIRLHVFYNRT